MVKKEKIQNMLAATLKRSTVGDQLYTYHEFASKLQEQLENRDIFPGINALGVKCFCRDDNQDGLGYLLAQIGKSGGWFDMNAFGAYPVGRSIESFGPPSHHIPDKAGPSWIVLVHATHVGCSPDYTFGFTDRYGMQKPGSSCGLLATIINRHMERKAYGSTVELKDFEMREAEKILAQYLDEIIATEYPMVSIADKLLDLGCELFDLLLSYHKGRVIYLGGINIDITPENPEKNLFLPRFVSVYENSKKTEIDFN